jgi:hypothetical protein
VFRVGLFTLQAIGGRQVEGLRERDADGVEDPLGVVVAVQDLDHFFAAPALADRAQGEGSVLGLAPRLRVGIRPGLAVQTINAYTGSRSVPP